MDYIFPFALLLVFYLFIIRPPMTRAKNEKKFASSLKRGDRIITKSGLHAKVVQLNDKDDTCTIETLAGKLKVERSAISLEMSSKLMRTESK